MPQSFFNLGGSHHAAVVCLGGSCWLRALSHSAMTALSLLVLSLHASFASDCNFMLIPIRYYCGGLSGNNILGSRNYLCSLWCWLFVWNQGSVCSTSPKHGSSTCGWGVVTVLVMLIVEWQSLWECNVLLVLICNIIVCHTYEVTLVDSYHLLWTKPSWYSMLVSLVQQLGEVME